MVKETEPKKYLFEYNLISVNILSFIILFACFYGNKLVEKILNKNFMETTGIKVLENASDSEVGRKLIAFFAIAFIVLLFWFILHEIIHGVAYRIMGAKKEDISFGIVLEKGIFYCKCSGFVGKKCILVSVLAPFVLIGVVTYIIGVIFNLGWLVYLSLFNIAGAAGDLGVFTFFVARNKDFKFKELDDSTTFCIETTEDLTDKKFMFVKLKEVLKKDVTSDTKTKLINITKPSYIILGICFILLIISAILMVI